jgi:hypothetical protein
MGGGDKRLNSFVLVLEDMISVQGKLIVVL